MMDSLSNKTFFITIPALLPDDINQYGDFESMVSKLSNIIDTFKTHYARMYAPPSNFKNTYEAIKEKLKCREGFGKQTIPDRKCTQILEEKILETVFKELAIPKKSSILEIGAGQLNNRGESYLMELLPNSLKKQVIPTDIDKMQCNNKHAKNVDFFQLSQSFALQSQDLILGSAVLDTLNKEDLDNTLEQISLVLKQDAKLIHITSKEHYLNSFLAENMDENNVSFPLFSEAYQMIGLQILTKEALKEYLKLEKKITENERFFLENYGFKVNARFKEVIFIDLALSKITLGKEFSDWVKGLHIPGMQYVYRQEHFQSILRECAKKHGLQIDRFETVHETVIIPRPLNEKIFENKYFNRFTVGPVENTPQRINVLAKTHIQVTASMEILVATKKKL